MKRILSVALFGFVVSFIAGATVGGPEVNPDETNVMPPNCGELCGGAYTIIRGQCVCM